MLGINTNLSSLIAQNNLKQSSTKLNTAIERMSTGCKINHAKDNSANYSISTNMTTKIGAYQVAEDNALQGLDMINTASESLTLIEDKLMRLRALAEQSANGTYGAQSKQAINQEANAIVDEINRIYSTAEYNGRSLFDNGIKMWENENSPKVGINGFIEDISRKNTSSMIKLSSVADKTVDLQDGEYSISTPEEMFLLTEMSNAGLISSGDTFVLACDIDLSKYSTGEGWPSITGFHGTFDGNGYTISNVYVNKNSPVAGLFGSITDATIKNVGVVNANISSTRMAAALVGYCDNTTVENCYSTGRVQVVNGSTDYFFAGLIACINENTIIKSCYSGAEVNGARSTGGLLGQICATGVVVDNCFATGSVNGIQDPGGFIGTLGVGTTIANCYATGDVFASNANAGGFIGFAESGSAFIDCYATGDAISLNEGSSSFCASAGHISLMRCYSTGNATGISANCFVGGLIGNAWGDTVLEDCYSLASLDANTAGGLIGCGYNNITINNSTALIYNTNLSGVFVGKYNSASGQVIIQDSSYSNKYTNSNFIGGTYDESKLTVENIIILKADNIVSLQVGTESSDSNQISLDTHININKIKNLKNIANSGGDLLAEIDRLSQKVMAKQIEFGAVQNRLESVVEEIGIQYDNLVSSRSTLRDADIAEVSAEYIQQQILQQASATLLATANQSPSIALQLI